MEETKANDQPAALMPVDDLDTFVRLLFGWHEDKVRVLEHVLEVPEGVTVSYNTEEGETKELVLDGEVRQAFILGVTLGLMELGTLPFQVHADENQEAPNGEVLH